MCKVRRVRLTLIRMMVAISALAGGWGLTPALTVRATDYPGAAFFGFQCGPSYITFTYRGTPVLQAQFAQIAAALGAAKTTRQNQPILMGEPASLWALTSDELQIHLNANPDATKLVLRSSICGVIGPGAEGSAVAYAQVTGQGRAVAYAEVGPTGAVAFAQAAGTGTATAYAQATSVYTTPSGQRVYVVQRGDTLYSIARRFGTTVSVLAAINRLSDPNVIRAGQLIYLP